MHVKKVPFEPGVQIRFIQLLPTKVDVTTRNRYCILGVDEMSITAGSSYDNGNSSLLGHCTLRGSKGLASKAVVGALGFLCARVK